MDEKPRGVQLIGIIDLLFGFCVLGYLCYGAFSWVIDFSKTATGINITAFVALVLLLVVGVFLIRLAFLTLRLRRKAISGNIIVAVFVIMEFLGSQLQYQSKLHGLLRMGLLAYSVWMICYLNRRSIKEQFR